MRTFTTSSPAVNIMARAAFSVGRSLVRDFGEIHYLLSSPKGVSSFSSASFRKAEATLTDVLSRAYPKASIITSKEDDTHQDDDGASWILSPISGFQNFAHGIPHFATSIAWQENNELLASVVYDPLRDELFWAAKNMGTFLHQTRLHIGTDRRPEDLFIAAQSLCQASSEDMLHFQKICTQTRPFRMSGASALDMAYVACGRYDGFWGYDSTAPDIFPGILAIREAGGETVHLATKRTPILISGTPSFIHHIKDVMKDQPLTS